MKIIRIASLVLIALLSGCADDPAARHEAGRKIYNFRCYYCHGYSGDARTLAATYLNPKPRDFQATSTEQLPREVMLKVIAEGKPGTAMKGFGDIIKPAEVALVADFVRNEFIIGKKKNTAYHTPENGWENHQRYAIAYPFATGEVALDVPWEQLTPVQVEGKKLFLSACISCHDRARVNDEGAAWELRALSYPRTHYDFTNPPDPEKVDAVATASPYLMHDRIPKFSNLTALEKKGEGLYQKNCAFCHAADGTAKNWIGSFMEPHPRDLTSKALDGMTRERLANTIRNGLPNTSMPAWKDVLSSADIEAVIAYINRAFHPVQGVKGGS